MQELVIPLRIDSGQVNAELKKIANQGQQTGDDVAKGAKKAEDSHNELAAALRRVNMESMALSAGRQALDALAEGAVKASEELKRMAMNFVDLRDRARELAGVMNQKGNNQFTMEQLQFAYDTGFADPQKALDFRTAFQGEA